MFDIGFWELVVIAVCALLVLGPERLPGFMTQVARWFGQVKRFANNARRELESELELHRDRDFEKTLSDVDDLKRNAPDREYDDGQ